MPPGPSRVIRRQPGRLNQVASCCSSAWRPTKGVSAAGSDDGALTRVTGGVRSSGGVDASWRSAPVLRPGASPSWPLRICS